MKKFTNQELIAKLEQWELWFKDKDERLACAALKQIVKQKEEDESLPF